MQRGYSRHAERLADEAAIGGLKQRYGHAGGGAALFQVLADYKSVGGSGIPSMLSTHPSDTERIARAETAAAGWQAGTAPLRPLEVEPVTDTTCAATGENSE